MPRRRAADTAAADFDASAFAPRGGRRGELRERYCSGHVGLSLFEGTPDFSFCLNTPCVRCVCLGFP